MSDSRRILVVDDEPDIRELAETLLDQAGYRATSVASGGEALDRLAQESFDLVLLDINMPGMDGWETLRLIRADERLADLVVVMFSVKGDLHDKVMGMQEGALDYITKPFVVDELLERIGRIFDHADEAPAPPARPVS